LGKLEIAGHVGWIDTLTKEDLDGAFADNRRLIQDALRGIKYIRLPPLQGFAVGGVLDIGGDTIANLASGQPAWSGHIIGPTQGNAWQVKRLAVSGLTAASAAGAATTSTATGAIAAGAGAAALGNGVSATGFTVTFSAAPSTVGTLVLSNVTGGPYTYNVTTTPANPYSVTFPGPITATNAGVAPTLTAAGLGTGAGTIELYGTAAGAAAVAGDVVSLIKYGADRDPAWYFSGQGGPYGPEAAYPDGALILHGGEGLRLLSVGVFAATGLIRLTGEITQIPEEKLAEVIS
jgi:hypothetical protein